MSPFPKKIGVVNNINVCATPMSLAMELYNWLNEMTKLVKSTNVKLHIEKYFK